MAEPTGPWLGTVYYPSACNRYYGLMRQSDKLLPVWVFRLLWPVFALAGRSLIFPSLLVHASRTCRDLYPVGGPSSCDG